MDHVRESVAVVRFRESDDIHGVAYATTKLPRRTLGVGTETTLKPLMDVMNAWDEPILTALLRPRSTRDGCQWVTVESSTPIPYFLRTMFQHEGKPHTSLPRTSQCMTHYSLGGMSSMGMMYFVLLVLLVQCEECASRRWGDECPREELSIPLGSAIHQSLAPS